MAILGGTALTLADWAKRSDPDGKIATIVEILSQTNEILDDMLWIEGNLPTGHQTTVRTGLPVATWRLMNAGIQSTRSTTAALDAKCGDLEAYSDIDVAIAELNGNTADFRLSEDYAYLEGMNQQVASALMYSNSISTPQQILGFSPLYNTVNPANAQSADNVIDAGGTGSTNASIWAVVWGPNTCSGIFPKGKITGLQHRDMGQQTKYVNNTQYEVYRTHYKWELGLCVRDWRYVVRIANIDVTTLNGGSPPNLINALIRAVHRLPTAPVGASNVQTSDAPDAQVDLGRTAIYCNRVIGTYLDIQATNKTNVLLQMEQWAGKPVTTFRGIPVRTVDAMLNTEARVI